MKAAIAFAALFIAGCGSQCEYANDAQWSVGIFDADGKKIGECTFPAGPVVTNRRSYAGGEHHGLSAGVTVEEPYTIQVSRNP